MATVTGKVLSVEDRVKVISKLGPVVDAIKDITNNKYVIAGGCIASILQDEEPNDYDIYSARNYIRHVCKDFDANPKAKLVIATKNAKTYLVDGLTIQLIVMEHVQTFTPEFKFDFKHCMNKYDPFSGALYVNYPNLIKSKTLEINPSYTINAAVLKRLYKFAGRGYKIPTDKVNGVLAAITNGLVNLYSDGIRNPEEDLTSYCVDGDEAAKAVVVVKETEEWLGL